MSDVINPVTQVNSTLPGLVSEFSTNNGTVSFCGQKFENVTIECNGKADPIPFLKWNGFTHTVNNGVSESTFACPNQTTPVVLTADRVKSLPASNVLEDLMKECSTEAPKVDETTTSASANSTSYVTQALTSFKEIDWVKHASVAGIVLGSAVCAFCAARAAFAGYQILKKGASSEKGQDELNMLAVAGTTALVLAGAGGVYYLKS